MGIFDWCRLPFGPVWAILWALHKLICHCLLFSGTNSCTCIFFFLLDVFNFRIYFSIASLWILVSSICCYFPQLFSLHRDTSVMELGSICLLYIIRFTYGKNSELFPSIYALRIRNFPGSPPSASFKSIFRRQLEEDYKVWMIRSFGMNFLGSWL